MNDAYLWLKETLLGEHRAEPAPVDVPTCPRCKSILSQSNHSGVNFCRTEGCLWQQPDARQRPPYPAPVKGWRITGECREPGIDDFWPSEGSAYAIKGKCGTATNGLRWIMVRDEPPAPVVPKVSPCVGCKRSIYGGTSCTLGENTKSASCYQRIPEPAPAMVMLCVDKGEPMPVYLREDGAMAWRKES